MWKRKSQKEEEEKKEEEEVKTSNSTSSSKMPPTSSPADDTGIYNNTTSDSDSDSNFYGEKKHISSTTSVLSNINMLDIFWYRLSFREDSKTTRCVFFPSSALKSVLHSYRRKFGNPMFLSREIHEPSRLRLGLSRSHVLFNFTDMWIGDICTMIEKMLRTKKRTGASSAVSSGVAREHAHSRLRARLLLDEINLLGPLILLSPSNHYRAGRISNQQRKSGRQKTGSENLSIANEMFVNTKDLFCEQFTREAWGTSSSSSSKTTAASNRTSATPSLSYSAATQDYFKCAYASYALKDMLPSFSMQGYEDPLENTTPSSLKNGATEKDSLLTFALRCISWEHVRDGRYIVHATTTSFPWSHVQAKFARIFDMSAEKNHKPTGQVKVEYDVLVDTLFRLAPMDADCVVDGLRRHACRRTTVEHGVARGIFVKTAFDSVLRKAYRSASRDDDDNGDDDVDDDARSGQSSSSDKATVASLRTSLRVCFPKDFERLEREFVYGDGGGSGSGESHHRTQGGDSSSSSSWTEEDERVLREKEAGLLHFITLGFKRRVVEVKSEVEKMKERRRNAMQRTVSEAAFVASCTRAFEESYDFYLVSTETQKIDVMNATSSVAADAATSFLCRRIVSGPNAFDDAMSAYKSLKAPKVMLRGLRIVRAADSDQSEWYGECARTSRDGRMCDLIRLAMVQAVERKMERIEVSSASAAAGRGEGGARTTKKQSATRRDTATIRLPYPPLYGPKGIIAASTQSKVLEYGHAMQLLECVRAFYVRSRNVPTVRLKSRGRGRSVAAIVGSTNATTTAAASSATTTNGVVETALNKLVVVGSLHGQLQDLLTVFSLFGSVPSAKRSNHFVFAGNIVGEDCMSFETFIVICALKQKYPDRVHILRGSNESRLKSSELQFDKHLRLKYGDEEGSLYRKCQECFDALPLGIFVEIDGEEKTGGSGGTVEGEAEEGGEGNASASFSAAATATAKSSTSSRLFIVHGGLFRRYGVLRRDLESIHRFREPPVRIGALVSRSTPGLVTAEDDLFECLLWSTPIVEGKGTGAHPTASGRGVCFGLDKSADFLWHNRCLMLIQSHGTGDRGEEEGMGHEEEEGENRGGGGGGGEGARRRRRRRRRGYEKVHFPQEVRVRHSQFTIRDDTSFRPMVLRLCSASNDAQPARQGAFFVISVAKRSRERGDAYDQLTYRFKTNRFRANGLCSFRLAGNGVLESGS